MQWESENKQENLITILHTVYHVWYVEREKGEERNWNRYFNRRENKLFLYVEENTEQHILLMIIFQILLWIKLSEIFTL